MKFEHKGISIDMDSFGRFVATVNSVVVRKPSLDAIKKYIDESKKTQFEPFTAIRERHYNDPRGTRPLITVDVIGVVKNERGRWNATHRFVLKGDATDSREHTFLFVDSAENRAAIEALAAHKEETRRISDKRAAEEKKLLAAIKTIKAAEYAVGRKP